MAAILFYSQMLYQLSYSRNCNEHPVLDRKKSINQKLIKRTESHYLLTRPPWKPKVMPPQAHNFTKLLFARPLCLLSGVALSVSFVFPLLFLSHLLAIWVPQVPLWLPCGLCLLSAAVREKVLDCQT